MSNLNDVKCPKCEKSMTKGYVYSAQGLSWATDMKKKMTGIGDESLIKTSLGFFIKKYIAYRCEECGIVTIEYK